MPIDKLAPPQRSIVERGSKNGVSTLGSENMVFRRSAELELRQRDGETSTRMASVTSITVENALRVSRDDLGTNAPVSLFRLVRLVAFEEILGRGAAGPAYIAGKRLGKALGLPDLDAFLKLCTDLNIGKIKVPKHDDDALYVDVYECVTCAGLETVGRKLCSFEGGLIAGVVESIVGKPATATEITCIGGLGHESCGFDIQLGAGARLRRVE